MSEPLTADCCHAPDHHHEKRFDVIFWGSTGILLLANLLSLGGMGTDWVTSFAAASVDMLSTMWWGILAGVIIVGFMSKIPREYFQALMGPENTASGIFRAVIAGLFLDLCSHGILLIAAKLYERGVSLPQIMTFLIASPWNSFSLTLILISLIGLNWTLIFIAGSCVIALLTGFIYIALQSAGILPKNPNTVQMPNNFSVIKDAKARLKNFRLSSAFFKDVTRAGLHDGRLLVRWLLLGVVIAAAIQTFVSPHMFHEWLGPTLIGLAVTLVAATIIEVCSEGSVPIATVIMNQAAAPGNAFAFLMAGVSTDYTEMMILRQATGSWRTALFMPLVTVPQILVLGYILNSF